MEKWTSVGREGQHDEVGVEAVDAVPRVGVVAWQIPLEADVIHDLVLPLPRYVRIRQNHLSSTEETRRTVLLRQCCGTVLYCSLFRL